MISAAGKAYARSALAPLAGSANVLAPRIVQEDVGATASALGSPLEPSPRSGKWLKVRVIGNGDEQIYVLRINLVGRQGADKGDPKHPRNSTCCSYEATSLQQKELAQWRRFVYDASHGESVDYDA